MQTNESDVAVVTTVPQDLAPFMTVTGADERTDMERLAGIDVEVGFLYSVRSSEAGSKRYPPWVWIEENAGKVDRAALHICGNPARRQLLAGELDVGNFQRIQINGDVSLRVIGQLCHKYPHHHIIGQLTHSNRNLVKSPYPNFALLVDESGGNGISPAKWEKALTDQCAVGYAGGLGPDNLYDELVKIHPLTERGWWVDMEGKIRTDEWFDLDLVDEVVSQWDAFEQTHLL